jgi:hypothetical protein
VYLDMLEAVEPDVLVQKAGRPRMRLECENVSARPDVGRGSDRHKADVRAHVNDDVSLMQVGPEEVEIFRVRVRVAPKCRAHPRGVKPQAEAVRMSRLQAEPPGKARLPE